jgi:hypothetical protein
VSPWGKLLYYGIGPSRTQEGIEPIGQAAISLSGKGVITKSEAMPNGTLLITTINQTTHMKLATIHISLVHAFNPNH